MAVQGKFLLCWLRQILTSISTSVIILKIIVVAMIVVILLSIVAILATSNVCIIGALIVVIPIVQIRYRKTA